MLNDFQFSYIFLMGFFYCANYSRNLTISLCTWYVQKLIAFVCLFVCRSCGGTNKNKHNNIRSLLQKLIECQVKGIHLYLVKRVIVTTHTHVYTIHIHKTMFGPPNMVCTLLLEAIASSYIRIFFKITRLHAFALPFYIL